MVRQARRVLPIAAGALLVVATAAHATALSIDGNVSPLGAPPGTPLDVRFEMLLTPEGDQSSIVTKMVLKLPPAGIVNGRMFPSCSPEVINARRSFAGCPKGSRIGGGGGRADVEEAGVFGVPATVTLFNGPGGRTVTVHVYAENPALVSEAFSATLTRTSGRYGYVVTAPFPPTLQEISDGWFVELRTVRMVVGATTRDPRTGRRRGYIEARRCPSSGTVPVSAGFEFLRESAPVTAVRTVACR